MKLFKEGPGRERSITVKQAELLLGELPAHQRDVVVFALATGLRQSNVLGLEWSPRRPGVRSCLGRSASIQEPQADRSTVERNRRGSPATAARQASRAGLYLCRKTTGDCQHEVVEESLETRRHRELPLARFEAHLGLVASPIRHADARAAAVGRLAVFSDGRTLRAFRTGPSCESRQPTRFANRRLRFGYVAEERGSAEDAKPL